MIKKSKYHYFIKCRVLFILPPPPPEMMPWTSKARKHMGKSDLRKTQRGGRRGGSFLKFDTKHNSKADMDIGEGHGDILL